MTDKADRTVRSYEPEWVALPKPLQQKANDLMSPFIRQILFSCGTPERDPAKILKESGVNSFQERLTVHDVRRLTKEEIRGQYPSAYIAQLLREAATKQTNLRRVKSVLGKVRERP